MTRTTALRSLPSSASAWNSRMLPPAGTSIVNDGVRSRREIVRPDRRAVGTRAKRQRCGGRRRQDRAQGLRRQHRTGNPAATLCGRRRCGRRGGGASGRRSTPGRHRARHDPRVAPDDDRRRARAGATSLKRIWTFCGPGVDGPPRPRPPALPIGIREVTRRLDLQRLVVERQRALVTGAAGREIASGEEPARPGRQALLDLVARRARPWSSDPGCRTSAPAASASGRRSRASDRRCSACSRRSRCDRRSGR